MAIKIKVRRLSESVDEAKTAKQRKRDKRLRAKKSGEKERVSKKQPGNTSSDAARRRRSRAAEIEKEKNEPLTPIPTVSPPSVKTSKGSDSEDIFTQALDRLSDSNPAEKLAAVLRGWKFPDISLGSFEKNPDGSFIVRPDREKPDIFWIASPDGSIITNDPSKKTSPERDGVRFSPNWTEDQLVSHLKDPESLPAVSSDEQPKIDLSDYTDSYYDDEYDKIPPEDRLELGDDDSDYDHLKDLEPDPADFNIGDFDFRTQSSDGDQDFSDIDLQKAIDLAGEPENLPTPKKPKAVAPKDSEDLPTPKRPKARQNLPTPKGPKATRPKPGTYDPTLALRPDQTPAKTKQPPEGELVKVGDPSLAKPNKGATTKLGPQPGVTPKDKIKPVKPDADDVKPPTPRPDLGRLSTRKMAGKQGDALPSPYRPRARIGRMVEEKEMFDRLSKLAGLNNE